MTINGTEVTIKGIEDVSEQEILNYLDYIHQQTPDAVKSLAITAAEDGNIALDYQLCPPKFQRIRRITGYLVGTIDRWNDAKRAEERDRVKHGLN